MTSQEINDLVKEINLLSDYTFRGHLWARMSDTRPNMVVGLKNKVIIEMSLIELMNNNYEASLEAIIHKLRMLMKARYHGVDIYSIEGYDAFYNMYEVLYED